MIGALPLSQIRAPDNAVLHLTATTTGAGQTVTLQQITHSVPTAIDWGDGSREQVAAGHVAALSHVYAATGEYAIVVYKASAITTLDLRDDKLGGLNTRDLRGCRSMETFYLNGLSKAQTVHSAGMVGWGLSYQFFLYNCPSVTGQLDSADMTSWGLSYRFSLYNCSLMTGQLDSADMTGWGLSHWFYLYNCPSVTGQLDSADMVGWGLSYRFLLYNCPSVTGQLDSADMVGWGLSSWFSLSDCPLITVACANSADIVWTGIEEFTANDCNMTQASAENIIAGFLALKATMTDATPELDLGGAGNATPGGTYQAVCPPTTALEEVYDLVNGNCTPAGPEFASVVWNGGSAP